MGESSESERKSNKSLDETTKTVENKETTQGSTEPSEGKAMIVDKVHEHLQGALDAYNSRITPLTEIPKKLQEYLGQVQDLNLVLVGGSVEEGSAIVISVEKPMLLIDVLREMPPVEQVVKEGKKIQLILKAEQ